MGFSGWGDGLVRGRAWSELGNTSYTSIEARHSSADAEGQWNTEGEAV